MKKLYTFLAACCITIVADQAIAQNNFAILLYEDFETGALPTGWTRSQMAGSDGWTFGWTSYSSTYWTIPASVDASQFAASNDDDCNCDMSDDQLNSPTLDLSNYDSAYFLFDRYYDGEYGSEAYFQVSYDNGVTWLYLALTAETTWIEDGIALPATINVGGTDYTFNNQMKFGLLHYDGETWAAGFAVDNVIVAGFNSPCDDVVNISGCGVPQTLSLSGAGVLDFDFTSACGWDVPGFEQLYTFTPTESGIHTINVSSTTETSYFDYMYKPVSDGCDSLVWNCVADVFSTGEYGGLNLQAGVQYYILVDNESFDAETHTFTIECPCDYNSLYFTLESESCGLDLNGGCNSTTEAYEPIACGQILSGTLWADAGNRDTDWFQLVVTEATTIEVEFGGDLPMNALLVDNCTGFNLLAEGTSASCDIGTLSYAAAPGTYTLVVVPTTFSGYACSTGQNDYDLYVNYCNPPANDECAGAVALTVGTTCTYTAGTGTGATESLPACVNADPGIANDDVWFSFTPSSSEVTIDVQGSSGYDVVFEVYSGTCGSLSSLGCVDDNFITGGLESGEFTGLTPGMTYRVRVYDWYATAPSTPNFDICVYNSTVTGIDEAQAGNINLYPNPSNGTFALEMGDVEGVVELTVVDLTGRQVAAERAFASGSLRQNFDLQLATGNYILKAVASNGVKTVRFEVK
jgi:hypothetical protein